MKTTVNKAERSGKFVDALKFSGAEHPVKTIRSPFPSTVGLQLDLNM